MRGAHIQVPCQAESNGRSGAAESVRAGAWELAPARFLKMGNRRFCGTRPRRVWQHWVTLRAIAYAKLGNGSRPGMPTLRLAIAGGATARARSCRGSSTTGRTTPRGTSGLLHPQIGGYRLEDLRVVAAFDVDSRKVGRPLEEAAFAPPNCTAGLRREAARPAGSPCRWVRCSTASRQHMAQLPGRRARSGSRTRAPCDVRAGAARERRRGAWSATCRSAPSARCATTPRRCLDARASRCVNCVPVFIASDPSWAERFRAARRADRGRRHQEPGRRDDRAPHPGAPARRPRRQRSTRTYQLNTGGNTDFLNMLEHEPARERSASRRPSRCSRSSTRASPAGQDPHRPVGLRRPGRTTTRSASCAWSGAASATCR